MENAADALKIAFAVIIFAIALALTFTFVSQAKSTADHVLYYSDETNFYDYSNSSKDNRIVSTSEVISMLHKYYVESIAVIVKVDGEEFVFDSEMETTDSVQKEKTIAKFVKDHLKGEKNFVEVFVEAPRSGIYKSDDKSEIVITPGGSKIYVTYIQQN